MDSSRKSLKSKIHEIIFEADTVKGKLFDVVLLVMIMISVVAVCWESLPGLNANVKTFLYVVEWIVTIFFTIEYAMRLYSVHRPIKYATSFFGIIDLLSIIPTYLSIFFVGTQSLVVLRALRLLRIFRIFKMAKYLNQGALIMDSIKASMAKLTVFVYFVIVMVCVFGSIMYFVEGSSNSEFDSIPRSIYWAIVTLTTVGFGDITPTTWLGQFLSAILMIAGYAVIAVPTGIVGAELIKEKQGEAEVALSTQSCRYCSREGHDSDAEYCKYCGEQLNEEESD